MDIYLSVASSVGVTVAFAAKSKVLIYIFTDGSYLFDIPYIQTFLFSCRLYVCMFFLMHIYYIRTQGHRYILGKYGIESSIYYNDTKFREYW